MIWLCGKWTYNVHIYIYIEHRNLEIRKIRNDFSVRVRNFFLLPLSLKVLRHKERETQSFYPGFFICTPPPSRATPATKATGLAAASNRLLPRQVSTQLTFSKSYKILRALPVRDSAWDFTLSYIVSQVRLRAFFS